MQYIIPKDDTSTLSLPERTFLRSAARGVLGNKNGIPLRLDGRSSSDTRPIRLTFSRCHNRSECVVQFASGTRGAASVRAELVPPPNADRPNDGQVKFGVDVGPMGCMGYEVVDRPASNYGNSAEAAVDGGGGGGGGGGEAPYVQRLKSNRILRILERTLLTGGAMDAEALCVRSGSWVWRLHVDVSLLDDGGNAVDACVLAAVAALRHYRLPEVDVGGDGDDDDGDGGDHDHHHRETSIIHSDDREPTPLPLHHTPLTATFALFADETGTTSVVSALLDPSDREELACDGLLTWSYNKYGEMCCLDFPGGCELRPRQLMASARLGSRRCVEICQLLEAALEEAEGKAQRERMARLKALNDAIARDANVAAAATTGKTAPSEDDDAMETETAPPDGDHDDDDEDDAGAAAARKEEEEYRLRALDYGSGHFAAPVKEDGGGKNRGDRPSSQQQRGKKDGGNNAASSLFQAILRSAQSSSATGDAAALGNATKTTTMVGDGDKANGGRPREEPVVEIIARRKDSAEAVVEPGEKEKEAPSQSSAAATTAASDSEEEEVVQLTSEFSGAIEEKGGGEGPDPRPPDATSTSTPMDDDSDARMNEDSKAASVPTKVGGSKKKGLGDDGGSGGKSNRGKPGKEEADDITDLTQALKKKKKSKKSKKK